MPSKHDQFECLSFGRIIITIEKTTNTVPRREPSWTTLRTSQVVVAKHGGEGQLNATVILEPIGSLRWQLNYFIRPCDPVSRAQRDDHCNVELKKSADAAASQDEVLPDDTSQQTGSLSFLKFDSGSNHVSSHVLYRIRHITAYLRLIIPQSILVRSSTLICDKEHGRSLTDNI
jgi:hypothetical protein